MDDIFEKFLETTFEKKAIEEELRRGPIQIPRQDEQDWTPAKVVAMIVNPIYTGMGSYPQIVGREKWIEVVSSLIENIGSSLVLRILLDSLKQSLEEEHNAEV